jgi:putative NADH-flavin reductase
VGSVRRMKVTVFGAAGRTGRAVVRLAAERGHEVTAFVRTPVDLEGATVVAGDARDAEAVAAAIAGADAVVSVLALMSVDAEPEYSDATRTIVDAASSAGARRVIVTANNDVLTDREVTGDFAAHAREHRRNRATLEASDVAWSMLAAPWVTDDEPRGAYESVLDGKGPGRRIGSGDFALAVVDALERDDWSGHVVGVSAP